MIQNKIDQFHLQDIQNEIHPSVFFKHEDYDLFILRLPSQDNNNQIIYISLSFIITDNNYFYFDKEKKELVPLNDIMGFYTLINTHVDKVLEIVTAFWSKIETIEDKIYEAQTIKNFNKQWYVHKTDLIRINRVLNKAIEAFNLLIRQYKKEDDYLERNFEDIAEHIQRSQRNAEYLLEKLDSIYNFNLNQTNEQMNRIIYILTLLSGIFLPLNLIVGFFGMNTTSLPFTKLEGGTFNVIGILILATLLATLLTFLMRKK